jgi:hypothetical protein
MPGELQQTLEHLHSLHFETADAILWIVKRSALKDGVAKYSTRHVKTEGALQKKLVEIAAKAIKTANHVEEYEFVAPDPDEGACLGLTLGETDLKVIAEQIAGGSDNPHVEKVEELLNAWAYVIELKIGQERVLGLHRIPDGWKLKQRQKAFSVLFKNRMLMDFEEKAVFKLDRTIDCFAYSELVFILDKKKFETAMNFRAGMEKNRDLLLTEFAVLGLVSDTEIIRRKSIEHLNFLRRLSMIKKNGYYKDGGFIGNVKKVCGEKGWAITFEGNKIVVSEQNVELILKILNNDRLASLFTDEIFDVSAKKKVP